MRGAPLPAPLSQPAEVKFADYAKGGVYNTINAHFALLSDSEEVLGLMAPPS